MSIAIRSTLVTVNSLRTLMTPTSMPWHQLNYVRLGSTCPMTETKKCHREEISVFLESNGSKMKSIQSQKVNLPATYLSPTVAIRGSPLRRSEKEKIRKYSRNMQAVPLRGLWRTPKALSLRVGTSVEYIQELLVGGKIVRWTECTISLSCFWVTRIIETRFMPWLMWTKSLNGSSTTSNITRREITLSWVEVLCSRYVTLRLDMLCFYLFFHCCNLHFHPWD